MKALTLRFLTLLTIGYSTAGLGQRAIVVLINEVPTEVYIDGTQILAASPMPANYMAGYESTPEGYDIFQKKPADLETYKWKKPIVYRDPAVRDERLTKSIPLRYSSTKKSAEE
jgi:hypothetical protein